MRGKVQSFHFISGLPRSGSTLLAALLRQNPRFHADISSPLTAILDAVLNQVSAGREFAPMVNKDRRRSIILSLFDGFYAETDRPVVFDTSRAWCARLPLLVDLFPEAKLVCCVRDISWIMDSLERRLRAEPYEYTRLFNDESERATVYSRTSALWQPNRLVGFAFNALREAYFGEHSDRLLLLDYDHFVREPAACLEAIYGFLGEPDFAHDFKRVAFDAPAFDAALGVADMHRVRAEVAPLPRASVLPPDIFAGLSGRNFWADRSGTRATVLSGATPAESSPAGPAGSSRAS